MKKHSFKFGFLGALILSAVGINLAYADNLCDDPDAVHCAVMNGPAPHKVFKYFKIEIPNTPFSFVACANNTLESDLYKDNIQQLINAGIIKDFPANLEFKYSQCNDQSCAQSKSLGDDKYTLSTDGNGNYSSNPQYFSIAVFDNNYGASCTPAGKMEGMIQRLLANKTHQ